MNRCSKSFVEHAALAWLEGVGRQVRNGADIAPTNPWSGVTATCTRSWRSGLMLCRARTTDRSRWLRLRRRPARRNTQDTEQEYSAGIRFVGWQSGEQPMPKLAFSRPTISADTRFRGGFRNRIADRLDAGIVRYDRTATVDFRDGMFAVPVRRLWEAA